MRILGHNMLPLSVLQQGSGWASTASNGIIANIFFFEETIAQQGNFRQHLTDMRNLFNNAVAATKVILRPTTEGLLPLLDLSEGWKARSGSVYEIKNGVTIHYPSKIIPVGYSTAANVAVQTAYNTSLDNGNKVLWGSGQSGYRPWDYAGIPHDAAQPGIHLSITDITYDQEVTINAMLSDVNDQSLITSGTIAPINASGTVGTAVAWSIAAGQEGNMLTTVPVASNRFRFVHSVANRRALPVTASDVGQNASYKTIQSAIVVIQDTNYGALANGNYIPTYFACEVGAIGSGKPIEVQATALGPGEFATVAQMRLSTEV